MHTHIRPGNPSDCGTIAGRDNRGPAGLGGFPFSPSKPHIGWARARADWCVHHVSGQRARALHCPLHTRSVVRTSRAFAGRGVASEACKRGNGRTLAGLLVVVVATASQIASQPRQFDIAGCSLKTMRSSAECGFLQGPLAKGAVAEPQRAHATCDTQNTTVIHKHTHYHGQTGYFTKR